MKNIENQVHGKHKSLLKMISVKFTWPQSITYKTILIYCIFSLLAKSLCFLFTILCIQLVYLDVLAANYMLVNETIKYWINNNKFIYMLFFIIYYLSIIWSCFHWPPWLKKYFCFCALAQITVLRAIPLKYSLLLRCWRMPTFIYLLFLIIYYLSITWSCFHWPPRLKKYFCFCALAQITVLRAISLKYSLLLRCWRMPTWRRFGFEQYIVFPSNRKKYASVANLTDENDSLLSWLWRSPVYFNANAYFFDN